MVIVSTVEAQGHTGIGDEGDEGLLGMSDGRYWMRQIGENRKSLIGDIAGAILRVWRLARCRFLWRPGLIIAKCLSRRVSFVVEKVSRNEKANRPSPARMFHPACPLKRHGYPFIAVSCDEKDFYPSPGINAFS